MLGIEQHQDAPDEIFGHDVILHVVRVVLYAEGQKLNDQREELWGLEVIWRGGKDMNEDGRWQGIQRQDGEAAQTSARLVLYCVGKQRSSQNVHTVLVEEAQKFWLLSFLWKINRSPGWEEILSQVNRRVKVLTLVVPIMFSGSMSKRMIPLSCTAPPSSVNEIMKSRRPVSLVWEREGPI